MTHPHFWLYAAVLAVAAIGVALILARRNADREWKDIQARCARIAREQGYPTPEQMP